MTAQAVAEAYSLWWREAGLHSIVSDEPHGWHAAPRFLDADPANAPSNHRHPGLDPGSRFISGAAPADAAGPRIKSGVTELPSVLPPASAMPDNLASFRDWLAADTAQPEALWAGPLCLPSAITDARLLVIADMPDEEASDPAQPFAPARTQFLAAMLASIGLAPGDAALAPLAMRRPPGGLFDEPVLAALAGRMRRYLALARPRAVLILGDRTSRALIAAQGVQAPGSLGEIHLESATVTAAALPSPEHLMRRPTAKAASWQTLRLLRRMIEADAHPLRGVTTA